MSTVKTDAIETAAGGTSVLTLGTATQTLKIPGGGVGASKVLTSDAVGGATWAAASGGGTGGLHAVRIKTSSDATYQPAADVTKLVVHCQGAGGGASNSGGSKGVAGAAAGGYVMAELAVTSATVINVQVGAGGAAGVGSEGVGGDGNPSSVTYVSGGSSFTTITCGGGEKGTIAIGAQDTTVGGSAAGPTGCLAIVGGSGSNWSSNNGEHHGGDSMFGFGGRPDATGDPRNASGQGYGSGASGGDEASGIGYIGQPGIVIIYEYKG